MTLIPIVGYSGRKYLSVPKLHSLHIIGYFIAEKRSYLTRTAAVEFFVPVTLSL